MAWFLWLCSGMRWLQIRETDGNMSWNQPYIVTIKCADSSLKGPSGQKYSPGQSNKVPGVCRPYIVMSECKMRYLSHWKYPSLWEVVVVVVAVWGWDAGYGGEMAMGPIIESSLNAHPINTTHARFKSIELNIFMWCHFFNITIVVHIVAFQKSYCVNDFR